MKKSVFFSAAFFAPFTISAQAALTPPLPPGNLVPSLEETRSGMGIPSTGDLRGQKDTLGFAGARSLGPQALPWRRWHSLPP